MIHDIDKLVHKYGLQPVYDVVALRHRQMMKDVQAFMAESLAGQDHD